MNRGPIILTLTLSLFAGSAAWAQDDQQPASSPVPAFGQDNPAPTVSENPPISGIDQPGLEPHAAPQSFLLPGLHFSESVDSNVGNTLGGSSVSAVSTALGSLTLQKLWRNYQVAMDYVGGVSYYDQSGIGLQQLQQLDIDNRINWKRGQLAIRDSLSYLPEGAFGFGGYGGSGAYNSSLGSGLGFAGRQRIRRTDQRFPGRQRSAGRPWVGTAPYEFRIGRRRRGAESEIVGDIRRGIRTRTFLRKSLPKFTRWSITGKRLFYWQFAVHRPSRL